MDMENPPAAPAEGEETGTLHPADHQQTLEWLLVLDAVDIPHHLARDADRWLIVLRREDLGRAREQLEQYALENRGWPPPEPRPAPATQRSGWSAVWAAAMLAALYAWFGPYDSAVGIPRYAACDTARVMAGEWWRVVGAIGVHADGQHLAANLLAILGFGWLAARAFGGGLAWGGALLTAVAANIIGVFAFAPPRISLGASTATFALLGMLAGRRLVEITAARRSDTAGPPPPAYRPASRRQRLILYGAVLALFVILGLAPGSDTLGHFSSLALGLAAGYILGRPSAQRIPELVQRLLELGTVAFFSWSWRLALLSAAQSP